MLSLRAVKKIAQVVQKLFNVEMVTEQVQGAVEAKEFAIYIFRLTKDLPTNTVFVSNSNASHLLLPPKKSAILASCSNVLLLRF